MSKGWYGNKQRHGMASKGIKTRCERRDTVREARKLGRMDKESLFYDQDAIDEEFSAYGRGHNDDTKIWNIGEQAGLDETQNAIFLMYIINRGFTSDELYIEDWANRFKNGSEWYKSDLEGRRVLKKIAPDLYSKNSNDFGEVIYNKFSNEYELMDTKQKNTYIDRLYRSG